MIKAGICGFSNNKIKKSARQGTEHITNQISEILQITKTLM